MTDIGMNMFDNVHKSLLCTPHKKRDSNAMYMNVFVMGVCVSGSMM